MASTINQSLDRRSFLTQKSDVWHLFLTCLQNGTLESIHSFPSLVEFFLPRYFDPKRFLTLVNNKRTLKIDARTPWQRQTILNLLFHFLLSFSYRHKIGRESSHGFGSFLPHDWSHSLDSRALRVLCLQQDIKSYRRIYFNINGLVVSSVQSLGCFLTSMSSRKEERKYKQ